MHRLFIIVFAVIILAMPGCDNGSTPSESQQPQKVAQKTTTAPVTATPALVPAAVQEAAAQGLPVFLQKIPAGSEDRYGFASRDLFKAATLGAPYQVCTLHPAEAQKAQPAITALQEWRFPIMAEGKACALLTVAHFKGAWRAVDIGAAVLARDLHALRQQAPKAADRHMLLRLYQARADFLLTTVKDTAPEKGSLYPLTSAIRELKLETGAVNAYTLPGVLPAIRQRFSQPVQPEPVQ